ncbi:MAG: prepilin peptidase [Rhizomicrobium sp.]
MAAEILLIGVLPLLLILAGGWDLVTYTIPNALSLALVLAFAGFALVAALPLPLIGSHLAAGLIGLVLGMVFFACRFIGGGDAKVFAAAALWFGLQDLLLYALTASIVGGGFTLLLLFWRKFPLPSWLYRYGWVCRLHDSKAGIPYGVALAVGGILILPGSEVFLG